MPNRGDDHEQHRRADPSSHRNSADRAGHGPRLPASLTTLVADTGEPANPTRLPDAGIRAGEIIGHRLWWIVPRDNELWLRSLAHDRFWAPGEIIYGNIHDVVSTSFVIAGGRKIWGGVYSHASSAGLSKEIDYWGSRGSPLVCGTIKMWGEVVECKTGYRAEYAKVASLRAIVRGEADLDALRRRYHV